MDRTPQQTVNELIQNGEDLIRQIQRSADADNAQEVHAVNRNVCDLLDALGPVDHANTGAAEPLFGSGKAR